MNTYQVRLKIKPPHYTPTEAQAIQFLIEALEERFARCLGEELVEALNNVTYWEAELQSVEECKTLESRVDDLERVAAALRKKVRELDSRSAVFR